MQKKYKSKYEISVPVYAYVKKVLEKTFGKNITNETLTYEFFIAAGNLYAPMYQTAKKLGNSSKLPNTSNNIKIEMLDLQTLIPDYTKRLVSMYDKEQFAYSLATILNREGANILKAVALSHLSDSETNTKTIERVFAYFNITEEELSIRHYTRKVSYL